MLDGIKVMLVNAANGDRRQQGAESFAVGAKARQSLGQRWHYFGRGGKDMSEGQITGPVAQCKQRLEITMTG
ncbi:MAG: hypothetical protein SAqBPW_02700 [Shewanella algae]